MRLDRTEKDSEGFYLTPFQVKGDQIAEEFKIVAEVSACPHGPNGDYCEFRDQCVYTPGRYDGQPWYPTNKVRRRRQADQVQSSVQVMDVYHPCKFVTEGIKVCVTDDSGEEDCWTNEECGRGVTDQPKAESSTISEISSAAILASALITSLLLLTSCCVVFFVRKKQKKNRTENEVEENDS